MYLRCGNVAQFAAQKAMRLGAKVLTLSDSDGFIYDPEGLNEEKMAYVFELKNVRRGRIKEYVAKYPQAQYFPASVLGASLAISLCRALRRTRLSVPMPRTCLRTVASA